MDDYPLHQVSEVIRHAGTSDRNFYDRYYFNLHASSDELFMVMGMGQYPNLAVQDAFAVVRRGDAHVVVRASKELGDRMDTSVGPFRIEVIEPLKKLRFILEPTEHGIAYDLVWNAAIDAFLEPRQYIRKHGRVLFDTQRFFQTGTWEGTLEVKGEKFAVTPDRWRGTRDRSWGVRPVGEAEPPGIRQGEGQMVGMWNYAPMQFDDHSLLYMVQEEPDGKRTLSEAIRVWNDPKREPEWLGDPEYEHTLVEGGARMILAPSTLHFPKAPGGPFSIKVTPLTHCFVAVGTGYGMDSDWRHGMYQGKLVVQGKEWTMQELATWGWFGIVDHAARFEIVGTGKTSPASPTASDRSARTVGQVGFGLHEHGFFGPFPKYGLT